MKTVAIIGGSQKKSLNEIGKKEGLNILFHDGQGTSNKAKEFKKIVKAADCIIVMLGAVSHQSMWQIKEIAKSTNKPIHFHKGFGITGALCIAKQVI